jgi:DNA-binding response OmpR family regulator
MIDLSIYRVLVVDDEPDTLEFISTVLRDSGATVFEARDGDEALEVARTQRPDLMTLDLSMPGKDGSEVFEEMRSEPELAIPVCIISGRPELRRLIYQRSVPPPDGYLDKPVDERTLLRNVRKILSLSRRRGTAEERQAHEHET